MPSYITLARFTDQGMRSVKETVSRADAVREAASRYGITMQSIHWTQGQYDIVLHWEAPDDVTLAAFGLVIGAAGNVRSETMRAFSRDEMSQIVAKLP